MSFSFSSLKQKLSDNSISPLEIANSCIERIEKFNSSLGALVGFNPDRLIAQAELSQRRRKDNKPLSEWDGIPIAVKDNICIKGEVTSCGSKYLENYISPYDATVIRKLKEKGFLLLPRANMDEFAMGSSTENSAFQKTSNPFDLNRIPGGSSGGSAAAVAGGFSPVSLGSDTGGSIRQPASLTGIWGLKPTYGRVSRYGLVAYASSLDQIGPLSSDLAGIEDLLKILSGPDPLDQTTSDKTFPWETKEILDLKKIKIGIMENPNCSSEVNERYFKAIQNLKELGTEIVPLDFDVFQYSIPIYYLIATAECSSNLSRFDGIRYGNRGEGSKLEDIYLASRSQGFGREVKRRILLGTYALSSGYYEAYYGKAQRARVMIRKAYKDFFSKVDLILQPTSPTTAFRFGEKKEDPIQMYMADVLTISANLAGVPALNCPFGKDSIGLPIGMQITASHFEETKILQLAKALDQMPESKIELPKEIG